jgi:hypothetical protein
LVVPKSGPSGAQVFVMFSMLPQVDQPSAKRAVCDAWPIVG